MPCAADAARALGISRSTFRDRLEKYARLTKVDLSQKFASGSVNGFKTIKYPLPAKGQIARYIMTSAQNNTKVHADFWDNLMVFAKHMKAKLLVAPISYNKASYGAMAVKYGRSATYDDKDNVWIADALMPYLFTDRILVAPTLALCGEQNIIPTAALPLSSLDTYPGALTSAIFPHTAIAMSSTPAMKDTAPKLNYTTGAATLKNYIQKKEGLKAEFHHAFGASIIEVDHRGDWWVRQLNAKDDGSFYDLDVYVNGGVVTTDHRVEALNWGDIHWEEVDPAVAKINWGPGGILDTLKPKYQFMHDTLDFYARNHHRIKNPHAMYSRWVEKRDGVRDELARVKDFLSTVSYRTWCATVVVNSNHDNALERWLREADYRDDPANAEFFLECQLDKYRAIRSKEKEFLIVERVLRRLGVRPEVVFLKEDQSFAICKGQIECGQHGHLGPNGSKGSPASLSKVGKRANIGHFHSAKIVQGLYVSGTCSKLDLEYTSGPSSWTNSHIVTYPNGKRTILTIRNGRWKA